jgi:hypothetical protein
MFFLIPTKREPVQELQTLSHPLKAGQHFIFLSMKNTVNPACRNLELKNHARTGNDAAA